jgi:GNAT superfamily N-acetyltransferase
MAKRPRKRTPDRGRKGPAKGLPGLEFHDDPAEFLKVARAHLAADPVLGTVVVTSADEQARRDREGAEHGLPHRWWLVVRNELGEVVGAAMRTAPFAPHPLFLLPMPSDAAAALAHVLHARGEHVGGVNGALPAANVCAGVLAMLQGETAETVMRSRLHEARAVLAPRPAPGSLRQPREDEAPLVLAWFAAFAADAAEQAGRAEGHVHDLAEDLDGIRRRISDGRLWFWVDDDDRPVQLTGRHLPVLGSARVGPVYTPREHRGRGYAGNAVARVTQAILDEGARPCLYTDQANPTSNQLYAALGYEPVVDMVEMRIS